MALQKNVGHIRCIRGEFWGCALMFTLKFLHVNKIEAEFEGAPSFLPSNFHQTREKWCPASFPKIQNKYSFARVNSASAKKIKYPSYELICEANYCLKYEGLFIFALVAHWRFELQTPWLKVKCSTGWASEPFGWGGRIWTYECGSQRPVPYPLATPQW